MGDHSCPVCGFHFGSLDAQQRNLHVERHFGGDDVGLAGSGGAPHDPDLDLAIALSLQEQDGAPSFNQQGRRCGDCGMMIDVGEWQSHVTAHALHAEENRFPSGDSEWCSECGASISPEEADSHRLSHELEDEERQSMEMYNEESFRRLQRMYGMDTTLPGPRRQSQAQSDANAVGTLAGLQSRRYPPLRDFDEDRATCERGLLPALALQLCREMGDRPGAQAVLAGNTNFFFSKFSSNGNGQHPGRQGDGRQRQATLDGFLGRSPRQAGAQPRSGQRDGDFGFGCGYRNAQMLCSHLLARSADMDKALFGGAGHVIPIRGIQQAIEEAWQAGYDPEGAAQLGYKLVDTRKWIGPTEVLAFLRHEGVECNIVAFKGNAPAPKSTGDRKRPSADAQGANNNPHEFMFQWIWRYFTDGKAAPVAHATNADAAFSALTSGKPPLYIQHQGHSRTVVGALMDGDTRQLLIFDPSTFGPHLRRDLVSGKGWQRHVKRGLHTLSRHSAFELLVVTNPDSVAAGQPKNVNTGATLYEQHGPGPSDWTEKR